MADLASLNLSPRALAAALALQAEFPDVVFTSGRRTVADQARAMAQNIVQNRRYIVETYLATAESAQLQAWVDAYPTARDAGSIAAGLAGIMAGWSDDQRGLISKHFSGDAFDIQPIPGPHGAAIEAAVLALPGLTKFLTQEAGLLRWHAQFA